MIFNKSLFKECPITELGVDKIILVGKFEKLGIKDTIPKEIYVEGFHYFFKDYFFTEIGELGFWYETRGKRKMLLTK